jgi:hypothetical protein
MRRLSIQFTCLFALLPALALGCAAPSSKDFAHSSEEPAAAVDAPYAEDYAEASEPGGYDFSDDVAIDGEGAPSAEASSAPVAAVEAEAPADMAGGDAMGMADEAAPPPAAPTASMAKGKRASRGDSRRAREAEEGGALRAKKDAKTEAKIAAERDRFDRNIQSGTLTAGSFDDNLNPWVFDRFIDQVRNHPDLSQLASAFVGQRTVLRVQDVHGHPVGNAKVEIDGKKLMTRSDGRVVWARGWDSGRQSRGKATVSLGNARTTVSINDQIEQLVTLKDAQGSLPDQLDIALVIDATGSMGDELEYLKVEIRDISKAVHRHFPGVDQRFALVVYRDNGDQYTTRVFDFSSNLDRFQRDLGAQTAAGGGDYPEAMDAAMEATTKLSWRKGDTARVTFLVADAPPHANKFDDTLEAVDDLREKGVAIYPVASSGVAGEAEFVMRTAAMLTGAQYMFLTDDSGVGNPHAEPHIPCYTVEQLAPLMVRAVRSELSGQRVEPEAKYSIRTVGRGQAGVCEKPRSRTKIAK